RVAGRLAVLAVGKVVLAELPEAVARVRDPQAHRLERLLAGTAVDRDGGARDGRGGGDDGGDEEARAHGTSLCAVGGPGPHSRNRPARMGSGPQVATRPKHRRKGDHSSA